VDFTEYLVFVLSKVQWWATNQYLLVKTVFFCQLEHVVYGKCVRWL